MQIYPACNELIHSPETSAFTPVISCMSAFYYIMSDLQKNDIWFYGPSIFEQQPEQTCLWGFRHKPACGPTKAGLTLEVLE